MIAYIYWCIEKDSIAQQLHILEELKQTLTQQLSEKDNQITSLDARAQEMGMHSCNSFIHTNQQ